VAIASQYIRGRVVLKREVEASGILITRIDPYALASEPSVTYTVAGPQITVTVSPGTIHSEA